MTIVATPEWQAAIDQQIADLDDQVVLETAQRAVLAAAAALAAGQYALQLSQGVIALDAVLAMRAQWRVQLVDARALGYLPDPRSKFYSEDLGGFLQ